MVVLRRAPYAGIKPEKMVTAHLRAKKKKKFFKIPDET